MKTRLTLATFAAGVLATTLPMALNPNTAQAQAQKKFTECHSFVTGTYLTTIFNGNGSVASRGLITLTKDGNIIISDSNQAGVAGVFNPFGIAQGAYKCTGERSIRTVAVSFIYPGSSGPGGIGRTDYQATFDQHNQVVQGTISLSFFGLNDNPLAKPGQNPTVFTFTGQRINVK